MSTSYKDAGVNKEEGYQTVHKIKDAVAQTHTPNVLNGIGSFGAFYELGNYKNPVLVSGADGVGTKLRIALDVKKYDTVGIDCFAMCANDILCHGAKPLFFLDYLACGKLDSNVAAEIVGGIVKACKETNCSLIGGETAEMPGMYEIGDYDVAGFCVGVVEKDEIIDGSKIKANDVLIALPSSGFHSNGFSLIRKVFTDFNEEWNGKPLYETLLVPTKLYGATINSLLEKHTINGIAHITGGGLIENVPRILPKGLGVEIQKSSIKVPAIMQELQKRANIAEDEMFGTFNMGVGMVLAVSPDQAEAVIKSLKSLGEEAYEIGKVVESDQPIVLL
ncbi:phosphoribosylformylglycinamidine cyclo-ligase [Ornithobacterium rhinotracheale]|uniref:Phosphoribosylformylglycinamidine cyclo-ligase n=1 Tax=Ornithobacterium rhinotracheale (strain ATCC 51463 / DSM 15997 / CCUG 23171 / CIP 104009 / LMG 9086) TaxID=867902 RepID=I3ZZH0_ORNRL|nr:phosphoribosylformylglycinamidine cyclo-ligase [Ornithobacterium rhinotracheale]AFL97104.1 phosphoribosylformylglycinamidine cyclo-ligase [Ornithobacterium rhinotracheale DSM 15997]AIP99213.1 phosphoribosylformylglycinamidine cyclo-ligase [Ornithobacterium rhinotracheale ORT-UMN 88]KGB67078.1 phosphoribosylformylglycinamidine cyclo-ligase [Ornithobacterium rhinotracheale H06-030791]MBN3662303.1 phosphoribosylformylglycinamidine cyclo-ligase [Ornithobacterium rhinotracheale]MCK0194377.1 phos